MDITHNRTSDNDALVCVGTRNVDLRPLSKDLFMVSAGSDAAVTAVRERCFNA